MYRLNYVSIFGERNHIPVADIWHEQKTKESPHGRKTKERENEDLSYLLDAEDSSEEINTEKRMITRSRTKANKAK